MKILVLFTGGTIGSLKKSGYTAPHTAANYMLLENYKGDADFETVELLSILSENLTATEIEKIITAVADNQDKGYDGIILTHGTDTLQYTAAALAFSLPNPKLPIVLVSANYPLEYEKSNGNANFEAAVQFIKAKCQKGVFVSYKNKNSEKTDIHYGTRLYTHLENTDELYSIDSNPFAFYEKGAVTINPDFKKGERLGENTHYKLSQNPQILVINSLPGEQFKYDLKGVKAVLIRPYHSGTLNTKNENLAELCKKANEANIPVYTIGLKFEAAYESAKKFKEQKIEVLPNCTFASAYVKLWLANSNGLCIENFMKSKISSEYLE